MGGRPKVITAPASSELEGVHEFLVERAEKVRNRQVKPNVDNMLKITHEGRLAALDMRLIDPLAKVGDNTKLCKVRNEVMRIYRETHDRKGTQLRSVTSVRQRQWDFLPTTSFDTSDRSGCRKRNCIHPRLRYGYRNGPSFQMLREGRVRVLMGSTQKWGLGRTCSAS